VTALPARFYARPTVLVARRLLGQFVVSVVDGRRAVGRIVETEAYVGPHDPACHAFGGRRTARTSTLYGPPGTAYVYFTYGMHWCLNAVTEAEGFPAAVLIRALEPVAGLAVMRRRRGDVPDRVLCAGPARLCVALGVTGALNGTSLCRGTLRIVRDTARRRVAVRVGGRIGVSAAADWPLRFVVNGSPWVSKPLDKRATPRPGTPRRRSSFPRSPSPS
jgi:DNA-3-methyladenine glycosylase